jgi:transglutaminase-like putative cysteine protease
MRRRHIFLLLAFLLVVAAYSTLPVHGNFASAQTAPSRTIAFTYQVHVPATKDGNGDFLLWLPLPQQDEYQSVRNLQIESAVAHSQGRETENGNSYVLFRPTPQQVEAGFDAAIHFVATRFEHKVSLDTATAKIISANAAIPKDLQRDLEPDNLIPLNGVIADLAKEQTAGDATALAQARHIYDYVVATMRYDKSGDGWGRGDAVWACTSKRGNCTDFHSLLIGMMRASGIPARFEIGFPLPESKSEGEIPSYHCWAEFYLYGTGWVPVDASEAWKNPAKRDYFFGAHDVNRVFFTYGRDLHLSAQQEGDPLNYFIYPYAELNGKPFALLQSKFSFRDVVPGAASPASR